LAVLAGPDHVVLLEVLDEEAGCDDVVARDLDSGVGRVRRPADAAAVVGAPRPDVVEDRVVTADRESRDGLPGMRAADAEEHIVERAWITRVVRRLMLVALTLRMPVAVLQQRRRGRVAGIEDEAGDLDAGHVGDRHQDDAVLAVSVASPSPSTIVSARLTLIVWSMS